MSNSNHIECTIANLSIPINGCLHNCFQGFTLVLSKTHLDDDDVMEVDKCAASALIPSHEWLLDLLPTIPMFTKVKSKITATIRQVGPIM